MKYFQWIKDTHVLMKVKEHLYTGHECATPHSNVGIENKQNGSSNSNSRIVSCPATIRVLALTTPAARTADPNLNQTIQLAISQFNQARANSLIPYQASIILAGTRDTNTNESATTAIELNNLIADPTIAAWRDDDNADLVLLFTNGNYSDAIGRAGTLILDPDSAYAVVEIPEATTLYSATHEIGHLFGARHQTCATFYNNGCDNTAGFMHGFRYSYGTFSTKRRITMMHQNKYQHSRLLHFSNPNTSDHGRAMGTTSSENNARWIGEHANQVALFRAGGEIIAHIEGPYQLYSNEPYGIWEAVVGCGDAPYTYAWQVSYDGFNYGSVSGTSETFDYYSEEDFSLKLTVMSSDGQQRIATFYVMYNDGSHRLSAISSDERIGSISEPTEFEIELGEAYPNPTSNSINIPFSVDHTQPIKIELMDINGKQLTILAEGEYEKGMHKVFFSTSKLKTGLYMYKLIGRDFTNTKKIIINK